MTCGDISAALPIDVAECCEAFAGRIIEPSISDCADINTSSTLTWTVIDQNLPDGYVVEYLLTDGASGLILQISSTPTFTVNVADFYRVHPVVYNPSEFSLVGYDDGTKSIFNVNGDLVAMDLCADIWLTGGNFVVNNCCAQNLYIPGVGMSVPAGIYERDLTISSDGLVDNGPTDFDAGVEIELLPGFEVVLGVEFHAFIDGCN